jgi:hypothetical protein
VSKKRTLEHAADGWFLGAGPATQFMPCLKPSQVSIWDIEFFINLHSRTEVFDAFPIEREPGSVLLRNESASFPQQVK